MSEAVVWGRELDTATATTKYHGINIEEGEGKRREEGAGGGGVKSEMRVLAQPP
jgi:hypothetical protein